MPVILLCCLLGGCAHTITMGGIEGVIFPASKADFVAYNTGRKVMLYWTPAEADIAEATPRIKAFLITQSPSIASRLATYRCQYFGVFIDGKRRIYCNFFPADDVWPDWNWRTAPLSVDDGGDSYFQLEYEIETKRCLNFMVNGDA